MESFKASLGEVDTILKELKAARQDQAKNIRESYKVLVEKSSECFQKCQQRIETNLVRFVEGNLQQEVLTLKLTDGVSKVREKMQLIDKEIDKVRAIIANGCGTIHRKEVTDRQCSTSRSELGGFHRSEQLIRTRTPSSNSVALASTIKGMTRQKAAILIQRWWKKCHPRRNKYYSKREYP